MLKHYLHIFFISMLPLVELRLAAPVSQVYGLPVLPSLIVCMIGNMIPMPFIYLFARKFLYWGLDKPLIQGICRFGIEKGEKAGRKLEKSAGNSLYWALLLFVGIPLPGTGAWTGTLAASFLDLDFKKSVLAVSGGVLLAGFIMMTLSYLGVSAIK